jgi:hypothetical protein
MFGTVALVFFLLFAEPNPLIYKNIPFPPVPAVVEAGNVAPLLIEHCNIGDSPITYSTTHSLTNVVNGDTLLMPDVQVALAPGCTSSISLINKVPPQTPPGMYHVSGIATVAGTLHDFHVPWHSQNFEVIAPKKKK